MNTNVSFYRSFALQAHESVRNSRLYEGFPWVTFMNLSNYHFISITLNFTMIKAKVSEFQLEMQIKKLAQKALIPFIRKSLLPNSFLTRFSSSALLFSHFFSCSKSQLLVQDSSQVLHTLWSFPWHSPASLHEIITPSLLSFSAWYLALLAFTSLYCNYLLYLFNCCILST